MESRGRGRAIGRNQQSDERFGSGPRGCMVPLQLVDRPPSRRGSRSERRESIRGRVGSPLDGEDVTPRQEVVDLVGENERVGERSVWVRRFLRGRVVGRYPGWVDHAVDRVPRDERPEAWADETLDAFTRLRQERLDVDQAADAVAEFVSHSGNDHAAIAVPDQDDVGQLLPDDRVDDVGDVRCETDGRRGQMDAFAEPGQRDAIHTMAGSRQDGIDRVPIPTAAPHPRNDDIR